MPYDDNSGGFGGLGSYVNNVTSNPLFLAGLQMMGNNSPRIGAIPNTMEGVPTVLMSAQDRQRKAQEVAYQRQQDVAKQEALTQALIYGGAPEAEARKVAPSLPGVNIYRDYQTQKKDDADAERFFGRPGVAPAAPAAPPPAPDLAAISSNFDTFGQSSLGKTVAQVAAQSGNQTTAAQFVNAARQQGLSPESPITRQVLSNPATAMPLAKSLGIGADLPDDQWQQAHADAVQASKARQAAREAAPPVQQAQAQQPGPVIPFTQTGAPPAPAQPAPQQTQPQQQVPAPQPQAPAPQQQQQAPAPQQLNQTEQAMAVREQNRVAELRDIIANNERYMGSSNPKIKAAAASRVAEARAELAKEPKFQVIGKNEATGETQYGFVKGGDVTAYNPPKSAKDSGPVDERGLYPGETTQERLQSVPAEDRSFIQQMIDGRVAPPSSFAMKTPYWQNKMLQASRVDPELDYSKWAARVATRKDFDSGKTAQNLISMGQTYGHFDKLTKAIDELDNSNFPLANQARNTVLGATGSDKATNVKTVAKAVAAEVGRVFKVAGVVGEKETREWEKLIDPTMSPEQLKGAVGGLLDLIDSRVQEQGARWDSQFPNEPRRLYSTSAEKKLEQVRAWTESGAAGTAPKLPPGVKSIQVVQ